MCKKRKRSDLQLKTTSSSERLQISLVGGRFVKELDRNKNLVLLCVAAVFASAYLFYGNDALKRPEW